MYHWIWKQNAPQVPSMETQQEHLIKSRFGLVKLEVEH